MAFTKEKHLGKKKDRVDMCCNWWDFIVVFEVFVYLYIYFVPVSSGAESGVHVYLGRARPARAVAPRPAGPGLLRLLWTAPAPRSPRVSA